MHPRLLLLCALVGTLAATGVLRCCSKPRVEDVSPGPASDSSGSTSRRRLPLGKWWHQHHKTMIGASTIKEAADAAAVVVSDDVPVRVLTDFWNQNTRPVRGNAGAQEASRQQLRDAIMRNQYPDDCSKARLCTCDYFEAGLFANVHGRTACLLTALKANCTLVDVPTEGGNHAMSHDQYVNRNLCNITELNSPYECYFQPLSSCSSKDNKVEERHTTQLCQNYVNNGPAVMRRFGIKSALLLKSELTSFIMRPSPRLTENVEHWARQTGLVDADAMSRCLGVHIRHTDKKAVPASEKKHTAFVGAANDLRKSYGQDIINFMTDDPNVEKLFGQFPVEDNHVRVTTVPASAKRTALGTNDIGLQLITHTMLLAQCTMLLGSVVSNVDQVILELMAAVQWPPNMLDMYGDVYIPCAADEQHTNFTRDSAVFYKDLKATQQVTVKKSKGHHVTSSDQLQKEILEAAASDQMEAAMELLAALNMTQK